MMCTSSVEETRVSRARHKGFQKAIAFAKPTSPETLLASVIHFHLHSANKGDMENDIQLRSNSSSGGQHASEESASFATNPPRDTRGLNQGWRVLSTSAKKFSAKAAVIASIGGLLFGYDIGVIEGALPQLAKDMDLSLGQQDTVVAIMVAGALVGALFAGYLTDRLGRWFTIVLTDLTFIVGGVVLFAAQNPGSIFVGRFIVGMAVAVSAVADVSYLAEVAPESLRGGMVSCNELAISFGILASFLAGHVLRGVDGGWRYMFGFSAVLAILQLALMLAFMPRSPRWLMTKKRLAEAQSVLLKIRSSPEEVDAEMRRIELSDLNARGSLQELVSTWPVPLLVTTTLAVFQQLTGQANVLNFTVDIFEASGFRGPAPAVWLGLVKVVYTIVAITYVDKVGRRPLLLMGAAGCTASLWILSLGFFAEEPLLSFLGSCALVASYSMSFGPVTWLVTAETFPAGIRGKALGIGQVGSFAGNLLASGFFLRLLHAAGGCVTFFLFGSIVFVATVFIYTVVPETAGKQPEDIKSEIPLCGSCCISYTELTGEASAPDEMDGTQMPPEAGSTQKWL